MDYMQRIDYSNLESSRYFENTSCKQPIEIRDNYKLDKPSEYKRFNFNNMSWLNLIEQKQCRRMHWLNKKSKIHQFNL